MTCSEAVVVPDQSIEIIPSDNECLANSTTKNLESNLNLHEKISTLEKIETDSADSVSIDDDDESGQPLQMEEVHMILISCIL